MFTLRSCQQTPESMFLFNISSHSSRPSASSGSTHQHLQAASVVVLTCGQSLGGSSISPVENNNTGRTEPSPGVSQSSAAPPVRCALDEGGSCCSVCSPHARAPQTERGGLWRKCRAELDGCNIKCNHANLKNDFNCE